jgi:hypothetical protein
VALIPLTTRRHPIISIITVTNKKKGKTFKYFGEFLLKIKEEETKRLITWINNEGIFITTKLAHNLLFDHPFN